MMMPSAQLNNGLNNFDLAFNGTQRSAMSAADSLQDHLDEELTDVQPKLHVMSEPRSSFPPVMSPPTSGRAKKTVDAIAIHEDPPSTAMANWSRQHLNRVQSRQMSQDEQKENNVQDEEAEEAEEPAGFRDAVSRLPSRTSTGATESTIAQHASPDKSSEPNTRKGKTPAERGRSVRGSSNDTIAAPSAVAGRVSSQTKTSSAVAGKSGSQRQNRTVYDDSEEDSEQDETGKDKDKDEEAVDDDEESEDSEEEDDEDDEAVKSEPVSSSARR
jgi:hypothetical protein